MHQLERETYDDAFLNEAMEGFEEMPDDDHEETLTDLKMLLHKRASKDKKGTLIMWRVMPIAASVLVLLGVGYWFLTSDAVENQNTYTKPKDSKSQMAVIKNAAPKTTPADRKLTADARIAPKNIEAPEPVLRQVTIKGNPSIKYKTDTVGYIASDYKVRNNASVDEMLKKAEGFEVDPNGTITFNGQSVTKARLNGKDYSGGDVAQAIKSLPADIIEKFQIVDDCGDQAGRTGIKSGNPEKILNLTIQADTVLNKNNGTGFNTPPLSGFIVDNGYVNKNDTIPQPPMPVAGWKNYQIYLQQNAKMPDGSTGAVTLSFFISPAGKISNVRTALANNSEMSTRAIQIIKSGPKWLGAKMHKQVRLTIMFLPK